MFTLEIDDVQMPTPSGIVVSIMDLSKAERNAAGNMVIERIATKRKLEISYSLLAQDKMSQILQAISPVFFTVKYFDPQDNDYKTGTFYAGDRKVNAMDYLGGKIRWKDITFNLIER
jgi:hypothetical protein